MNFRDLQTSMASSVLSASGGVASATVAVRHRTRGTPDVATGKNVYTTTATDEGLEAGLSRRMVAVAQERGGSVPVRAMMITVKAADLSATPTTTGQVQIGSEDWRNIVKVDVRAGGAVVDMYVRDVG